MKCLMISFIVALNSVSKFFISCVSCWRSKRPSSRKHSKLEERKPSERNKTKKLNSKNLKKHEKQSPPVNMDKKVEIIQRYLNFSSWIDFAGMFFSAIKDQVDHSLQDVTYVLNNVREFWIIFTRQDDQDLVDSNSRKKKTHDQVKVKKSKLSEVQKQPSSHSGKKSQKVESVKKSDTKKIKQKPRENIKSVTVSKDEKHVTRKDIMEKTSVVENEKKQTQKSKQSVTSTESKTLAEKNLPKQSTTKEKEIVKSVEEETKKQTKISNTISKEKLTSKVGKEKSNDNQNVQKAALKETRHASDESEWKKIDAKSSKTSGDKSTNSTSSNILSGSKNVIRVEKNSKGKKEITIKENEKSGVKTVLVKQTKQTVYKQIEKISQKKSAKDTKENDESIGKLSFEELELLVNAFRAKDQEKSENLIDIIKEVQNAKNHNLHSVESNDVQDKTIEAPTSGKKLKRKALNVKVRAKTMSEIGSENLVEANKKADDSSLIITPTETERKGTRSKSSSDENRTSEKTVEQIKNENSVTKSVDIDPVQDKLEKIKNKDFDAIGKLSFDELGIIVNALVSENLVTVPKFSEPLRKPAKKTESSGRVKNIDKKRDTKSSDIRITKKENIQDTQKSEELIKISPQKQRSKKRAKVSEEIGVEEERRDLKVEDKVQTISTNVFVSESFNTSVDYRVFKFPNLQENHFGDTQQDVVLQEKDYLNHKHTNDMFGTCDLSQDMILCEKNVVKNISELLEDDSEVQTYFDEKHSVDSLVHETCWPTQSQSDIQPSGIELPSYFAHGHSVELELIAGTGTYDECITEEINHVQVQETILCETNELILNQKINDEKEEALKVEQFRKAVGQELKEYFETLAETKHNDEVEQNMHESGMSFAPNDEQQREENNLVSEQNSEEPSTSVVNDCGVETISVDQAEQEYSSTISEENLTPAEEFTPPDVTEIKESIWDESIQIAEKSGSAVDSEVRCAKSSLENENSEEIEDEKSPLGNQLENPLSLTSESVSEDVKVIESSSDIADEMTASPKPSKPQPNDCEPSKQPDDESSLAHTVPDTIVRASEDTDTGIEITEVPETSDRPHQTPVQTAPVKKTFIRPVIKIDRCGDNENVEPPPITPIDNMYTGDDEKTNETTPVDQRSSNNMVVQQQTEVRVLTLQDNQHQDGVHYRLKIGWTLELCLGESLFGRRVVVFCNIPEEGNSFQRTQYRTLEWANNGSDDTANYIRVPITQAGSFHYYFTFEGSSEKQGSGYIVVEPSLSLGGEPLPLDAIQCVTVLARCLGTFPTWERKLQVAKETGYNLIHFTPIQELGGSNSCYSLSSQLDLNPLFSTPEHKLSWDDVIAFTEKMRTEWQMLSLCDIVLNHTANETHWLQEHPEASYNLVNSPHLKPAYLLDVMLQQLSDEIESGKWEMNGVPSLINNEDHLNALRHLLHTQKLPQVRIPELYTLDIELLVKQFQDQCRTSVPVDRNATTQPPLEPLRIIQDAQYRRLKSTVDLQLALNTYNVYRSDCFDEDSRIRRCVQEFKLKIDELNNAKLHEIQEHLNAAVENFIAGVRYYRVSHDGPRHKEISLKCPLVYRYFTDYQNNTNIDLLQDLGPGAATFVMAHNGWVMGADPLQNFAAPESNVYLRRELIAWGDSVKLRFGSSPADNPWLWAHMKSYVEITARAFDGVRLDNCHSTPLPVAEYLLDAARAVRPNLYVVAELFTDSPDKDNIFVNKLGITSLIREAMSAWDSHELGRIVYRYGGEPIGAFLRPSVRPLVPGIAHALLLDLSHDNPCPITKRCVFDLLPSAALVSMAACASGSNTGYDTLVPHHIDVVQETRQYPEWDRDVTLASGIIAGKRTLNRLHSELGLQGYTQVFVDQVDPDIVAVTRHHPNSHESVLLVAFTSFSAMTSQHRGGGEGKGVTVSGHVTGVVLEAGLRHKSGDRFQSPDLSHFTRDSHMINGLTEYTLDLTENIQPSQVSMLRITPLPDGSSRLDFTSNFKPGCVVAVRISPIDSAKSALSKLSLVFDFSHNVTSLSLADLNKVLYCCGQEDGGTYNIPGYGHLVYCGLQGILSLMSDVAKTNDLGHPVCANLRDGHWLMDYLSGRLKKHPGTSALGEVLDVLFEPLKSIPRYLVPCYFHLILSRVSEAVVQQCYALMSDFVQDGSSFVKALALTSVQMGGIIQDAPLPPLSSSLLPPLPPPVAVTCAAGLPHFSTGFAGTLRHGLIPNLLDGGYKARYNCRDAVWWWLYTLQCYVREAPNGIAILQDKVNRLYPEDDDEATSVDQLLYEVVQEAVERHFQGVVFRERNAGTAIDAHMVSQGFDNQIGVHPVTGFVFGGNQWNCGTWMDKMGSSQRAGNKGRPATPRDGTAVELVGLSKATVRWLAEMNKQGDYPYSGVSRTCADGTRIFWTFEEWNDKIQANFERHFWIPLAGALSPDETRPDLVNRRGIYKDSYQAAQDWPDYQLRCNYPIAMVVAPELFTPSNARTALSVAEATLLGPGMGMRTLDPGDWSYRGDYANDNDSDDPTVAHGFNYHNGPEWLWPLGFFLRAKLEFAEPHTRSATIGSIRSLLARHFVHLNTSHWRGLPELTNKDGKECPGSCNTQAWSSSTLLEVIHDISLLESKDQYQRQ
ncbi:hypothetical protein M8J75_000879 [Diaphorina citri]|nr:hypothetical protein M8J75_000879 [Diaphorina citri]